MIINKFTKFDEELKKKWLELESSKNFLPFQKYEWLHSWYEIVGKKLFNLNLQIIHIQLNGKTIGILPFCIRTNKGVNILEWIGGINTDYLGPIYNEEYFSKKKSEHLWERIEKKIENYDVVFLQKQRKKSIEFLKIVGINKKHKIHSMSYQSSLKDNWESYSKKIKKKIILDTARQKKRINNIGKLEFSFGTTRKEKNEIINLMIHQKSQRYKKTKVWNMFSTNEYKSFYKNFVDLDSNNDFIHCSQLLVNNTPIATHVGIFDNSNFYYLMPAHSEDWAKYSPGRILLTELINWSINKKINRFDFTIGGEAYKKIWCDQEEKLYETFFYKSFKGMLFLNFVKRFELIKNLLKKSNITSTPIRYFLSLIKR